jgi:hypothetical protein
VVADLGEYGTITQGDLINTYNVSINAPGFVANTKNTPIENINEMLANLNKVSQSNIDYINKYLNWMNEGKTVVKAQNSLLIVGETPQEAIDIANRFQGGYEKTYTAEELTNMMAPYQSILSKTLNINLQKQEVPPQPISPVDKIISDYLKAHPQPFRPTVAQVMEAEKNAPEGFQVTTDAYGLYYVPKPSYWKGGIDYSSLSDAQKAILNIKPESDELLPDKVYYDSKTKQFSVSYKVNPEKWEGEREYSDLPSEIKSILSGANIYPTLTPKVSYDPSSGSFKVVYSNVPKEGIPYDKLDEYGLSSLKDTIPSGSTVFANEQGELYYSIPSPVVPKDINWTELPTNIPSSELTKYGITLSEPVPEGSTIYVDKNSKKFYVIPAGAPISSEGFTLSPSTSPEGGLAWVPVPEFWSSPKAYATLPQSVKDILAIPASEYTVPETVTYTSEGFKVSYAPDWSKLPDVIPYSDLAKYGLSFEGLPEGSVVKVDKEAKRFTVYPVSEEGKVSFGGIPSLAGSIFGSSFINVEGAGSIGTDPTILAVPNTLLTPLTQEIFNLTKDVKYPTFAAVSGAGGIEPSVSESPLESQLFYPGQALAGVVGSVEAIYNPNVPSLWSYISPESEQAEFMRTHPSYSIGAGIGEVAQLAVPVPFIGDIGKWASKIPAVSRATSAISHSKPVQLVRQASATFNEFMEATLKKVGYSPPSAFEDFLLVGTPKETAAKVASQSYSGYIESISDIQTLMKSRNIPEQTIRVFDLDIKAEPTTFTPLGGWVRVTPSKESKLLLSDIKAIDPLATIRQPTKATMSIMPKSPLQEYTSLISKAEYYDDLFKTATSRLGKPITVEKAKPSIGGVISFDSKATFGDLDRLLDTSSSWFTKPSYDDLMRQSLASKPPLYDALLGEVSNFKISPLTEEGFQGMFERSASLLADVRAKPITDIKAEKEISSLVGKGSQYQLAKKASQKGAPRPKSIFDIREAPDFFGTDLWMPTERITPLPDVVPPTTDLPRTASVAKKSTTKAPLLKTEKAADYDYLFTFRESDRLLNISASNTSPFIRDSLSIVPPVALGSAAKSVTKLVQKPKVEVTPKLTTKVSPKIGLATEKQAVVDLLPVPSLGTIASVKALPEVAPLSSLDIAPITADMVGVEAVPILLQSQAVVSKAASPYPKPFTDLAPTPLPPKPVKPKPHVEKPRKVKEAGWGYYELTHYVDDLLGISKIKMNDESKKYLKAKK